MYVNKIVLHGWRCLVSGRILALFITVCPCHRQLLTDNSPENCISLGHRYEIKYNIKQNGTMKMKG